MGNFNAGAIEASLALSRSDWTRDLKKTKKEIEDLERKSVTIGIDADTDNAKVAIDNLELMLDDLDDSTYTPSLDINSEEFNATLDKIDQRLDALDDRRVVAQIFADTDNAQVSMDNLERDLDSLDRDPVSVAIDILTREAHAALTDIEARLNRLDARRVVIGVDADADNALISLALVEQEMDLLENDGVNISVDMDAAAVQADLIELATFIQGLNMTHVDIDVDVDGYGGAIARLATLEAARLAASGDVDIDVDYDGAMMKNLVGSAGEGGGGGGGYLGLLKILLYAIIALAPVLAAAISSATFAIAAFSAAVVGALGPLAVFGAGIFGLVKKYQDAKKAGDEMVGPMGEFADSLGALGDAWDTFIDSISDSGFSVMADAIDLLTKILPDLTPLFEATAKVIDGVLESIENWMESPEYQAMLDFFMGFGLDMLETFIDIGGDLIRFFGRLFDAIAPFASEMMQGLADTTQGWADWADTLNSNDAFQEWANNAMEYGPMVLDLLGSIVEAFMNIGRALEPFAGPMLTGLTAFFDMIANMDPTVLGGLIAGFAGLYLGAQVLIPMIVGLTGAIELLGGVLAIAFSPIGLVVLAIAGLVAMIVYLWKTNDDFKAGIIDTWNAIKETIEPIITDISNLIRDNWGPITEWAEGVFGDLQAIVIDAFEIIETVVGGVLRTITFIWKHFGDELMQIGKGAFQIIGSQIRGFFQVIRGIFQVFSSLLKGDWRGVWEGIKTIFKGIRTQIEGLVRGMLNIIGGILRAGGKIISAAWNGIWGAARTAFSSFTGWVRGQWNDLIGWFRGLGGRISSAVSGIWSGIGTGFRSVINGVVDMWNGLSFTVDIPDKIPGLPDSFTVSTPNAPHLARGAYLTEPTLNVAGEAGPEIVAPEPKLKEIVSQYSGGNIDYGKIGAAVAAALATILNGMKGVTAEDLERLIEAASVNLNIAVEDEDGATVAKKIAAAVGFNLRTLGYGGKYA